MHISHTYQSVPSLALIPHWGRGRLGTVIVLRCIIKVRCIIKITQLDVCLSWGVWLAVIIGGVAENGH
jgi:hypothetical protein